MTLIIGATPHTQWQTLTPLLGGLGWSEDQTHEPESWYRTAQAPAGASEDTCYLLLHSRPELALARAMDEGKDPAAAFDEWLLSARQMLMFYKNNRRNAALVDVVGAVEYPKAFVKTLSAHLGLITQNLASTALSTTNPTDFHQLLGNQYVAQSNNVNRLLAELEACSLPIGDLNYLPPVMDVTRFFSESVLKRNKDREVQEQCDSLREENKLVLDQLFSIQEELERQYLENQDLKFLCEQEVRMRQQEQQKGLLNSLIKTPLKKAGRSLRNLMPRYHRQLKHAKLVQNSSYFDSNWYLRNNRDVASKGTDPLEHFLLYGAFEGRAPSEKFDPAWYLQSNQDVAESRINPLVHYLLMGKAEGRRPCP